MHAAKTRKAQAKILKAKAKEEADVWAQAIKLEDKRQTYLLFLL